MNLKIFQVYFNKDQLNKIDSSLTPFDNTENLKPELREYYIFKRIIDEGHANDLDAWGVFSHSWKEKNRYDANLVFEDINNNKDCDVFIFNPARVQDALMYNIWEQGEYYHRGLKTIATYVLKKIGYDPIVLDELMTDKTTCFCSYFVAKKHFWLEYIDFLDKVYQTLKDSPEDIKQLLDSNANYMKDRSLNLFSFLMERMFSTFIVLHSKKYKVYAKKYDYSLYSKELGPFADVIESLNNLKTLTLKYNSKEIFEQWNKIRQFYIKLHPDIMNVDK